MKTALLFPLLVASMLAQEQGFRPLFDGKTLEGWDGDPRLWSVREGNIAGSTEGAPLSDNSFLILKQPYGNFDLKLQVKLRNHNSGIQFRSERLPNFVMKGLQADMAEDNWWGSLYDEKGTRGTIVNGWKGKAETVVRKGDWNDYEVLCDGDLIQLKVNGMVTAEFRDPASKEGLIGLQLHKGTPMRVEFRNIRIKSW